MLTLKNLTVKVERKEILKNINFKFEKGKTYAIMGPNGSGKTTLARTIMGYPGYILAPKSRIFFNGRDITGLKTEKRARLGIFLSFQSPIALSGVNIYHLANYLYPRANPLKLREKTGKIAKNLDINKELLERSLNEGFSGGEKKKMEILQAAFLNPRLLLFDEIDTGVDVDALEKIAQALKRFKDKDRTLILITHYNRILKRVKPDVVLVIKEGKLLKSDGYELAELVEEKGYEAIR